MDKLLAEAKRLRVECLQVFSASPRTYSLKPLDPAKAEEFRLGLARAGIGPLVVHGSYLLNPASPEPEIRQRSLDRLLEEMRRGKMLGAGMVVFHPGSHRGSGRKAGLERLSEAVRLALEQGPGDMLLAVENTSGAGDSLGGRLEDLAEVISRVDSPRLAAALDTAHAHGAGHDLTNPDGVRVWLDRAETLLGREKLVLFHLNDSDRALGSRTDRHVNLGQGLIGAKGLSAVLAHPVVLGRPVILEPPRLSEAQDRRNLNLARRWRSQGRIKPKG